MRRSSFWASLVVGGLVALGCDDGNTGQGGASSSGSTTASTSTASSVSSTTSTASAGTGGAACAGAPDNVFALNVLRLGEGNSGEWKGYGFDLDGKSSTAVSTDVCKPNAGGDPSTAYPDGANGIDNSFGKNLLPTFLSLVPTWPNDLQQGLTQGQYDLLLDVLCLPPAGDATSLTTKLFDATALGKAPLFDGSDAWPVDPALLSEPTDPFSTTIQFSGGHLTGTAFDAGDGTVVLQLPFDAGDEVVWVKLTLHAARIGATFSPDHESASNGLIGGVLNTEEFVVEIKKLGAAINVCGTALFDGLIQQIRQSSDILSDGTQDPSKTCDGISIGLGFDMSRAKVGAVGAPLPPSTGCP